MKAANSILVVAWLFLPAHLRAAELPAVEIQRVFPEKLCYRPGAEAKFDIRLANNGDSARSVRLVCEIERELDERQMIYDQRIELAASEKKNITASWRTKPTDQWGFDLIASVRDSDGKLLHRKSDSFAVTDRNWRVGGGLGQWTVQNYIPLSPEEIEKRSKQEIPEPYSKAKPAAAFNQPFPYFAWTAEEAVAGARSVYGTHLEWFSWEPSSFNNRTPEQEIWLSGQGQYLMSKRRILEVNQALQKQGIQVWSHVNVGITGMEGMEFMRAHPEWVNYDQWGGDGSGDVECLAAWREGKPFYAEGGGCPLFRIPLMTPETVDFWSDQIIASTKMFGWDGYRSDGSPHVYPDSYWSVAQIGIGPKDYKVGFRYDGALVSAVATTDKEPEQINQEVDQRTLEVNGRSVRRIRKALPDFQFNTNILGFPYPGFMEHLFRDKEVGMFSGGYILSEGYGALTEPGVWVNNWANFTEIMQALADMSHHNGSMAQVCLWAPDGPKIGPGRYHASAIIRASQAQPLYVIGPATHARFALRYSALLVGQDVEKIRPIRPCHCGRCAIADAEVKKPRTNVDKLFQVKGSRGIWWKDFVYERALKDGRKQIMLHLLNEPNKPNYDEKEPAPPVQKNVEVSFTVPEGKRLEKVFLLNADTQEKSRLELAAPDTGRGVFGAVMFEPSGTPEGSKGVAKVIVPRLEYWDMLVFCLAP